MADDYNPIIIPPDNPVIPDDGFTDLGGPLRVIYTPLSYINTDTIECNPAGLANWLNQMVDRVNEHEYRIIQLINAVQELQNAIICLEELYRELEQRVTELEDWRPTVELRLTQLQDLIDNLQQQVNVINDQITSLTNIVNNHESRLVTMEADMSWWYSKLPRSKGSLPSDFRIGFGNINVMSANSGTPSLNIGLFTSGGIENNDIYFN